MLVATVHSLCSLPQGSSDQPIDHHRRLQMHREREPTAERHTADVLPADHDSLDAQGGQAPTTCLRCTRCGWTTQGGPSTWCSSACMAGRARRAMLLGTWFHPSSTYTSPTSLSPCAPPSTCPSPPRLSRTVCSEAKLTALWALKAHRPPRPRLLATNPNLWLLRHLLLLSTATVTVTMTGGINTPRIGSGRRRGTGRHFWTRCWGRRCTRCSRTCPCACSLHSTPCAPRPRERSCAPGLVYACGI